jgi:type IV pilus assembly protein PilM
MFSIGRKKHALLGIDISSTAIKLVELTRTGNHGIGMYRVQSFAHEPLPDAAVTEKKIVDVEAVGQAIRKAVVRSRSKARYAAVAVAGNAVITRVIVMPASLSDAEMEAQIQLEADQYIPYPLEEVNLDFDVIGPTVNSTDMVDVLLAASRRENVDDRVAALEIAGLTADIVDIETYAMENACALQLARGDTGLRQKVVAVADVGAASTTLHMLHNGKIIYTREQNFGGRQIIEDLRRRYDLTVEEAVLGLNQGGLPENAETEVIGPFRESLAQQISRALQFFYSASSHSHTDTLIIAGGAAGIPETAPLVEQRLGFPVEIANPFEEMAMSDSVDVKALMRATPAMMIAVGLALRAHS